jgi:hypothetical protein
LSPLFPLKITDQEWVPVLIFKGKNDKGHTSGWSIDKFWSWGLLSSSLKLHEM